MGLPGGGKPAEVAVDQIRTVSRRRVGAKIGSLKEDEAATLAEGDDGVDDGGGGCHARKAIRGPTISPSARSRAATIRSAISSTACMIHMEACEPGR